MIPAEPRGAWSRFIRWCEVDSENGMPMSCAHTCTTDWEKRICRICMGCVKIVCTKIHGREGFEEISVRGSGDRTNYFNMDVEIFGLFEKYLLLRNRPLDILDAPSLDKDENERLCSADSSTFISSQQGEFGNRCPSAILSPAPRDLKLRKSPAPHCAVKFYGGGIADISHNR